MDSAALLVARICGIVAWLLVSTSVLWGLAMANRAVKRVPAKRMTDLHRRIALISIIFTALHIVAWMANPRADFGLVEVLVPFASDMSPVAVAAGIVTTYLLVAVQLSSLLMHRIPRRIWSRAHLAALPMFVLLNIHVLVAGADRGNPLMLWTAVVINAWFVLLVALRWLGKKPSRDGADRATLPTPPAVATRTGLAANPPDARIRAPQHARTGDSTRSRVAPRGR